jgi:chemotaxis protein methyltransferase CheR
MAAAKRFSPDIKPLEQALAARFGWQSGASWRDELMAAVDRKVEKLGMDEHSYCRMAMASHTELDTLAELVSNSETRFFREPEQFNALRKTVIPNLIAERAKDKRLDLWSAACSTGEEAYSLAIVVRESLPQGENWTTNLIATDLRGPAIISASRGSYPSSSINLLDSDLRNQYFDQAEMNGRERHFNIAPAVRRMVAFRRANIYDAKFWKGNHNQFDLIICNNVLIYFHALAIKQTIERMAASLKTGGMLLVMKNETGYISHPRLRLDSTLPGSFFRKS